MAGSQCRAENERLKGPLILPPAPAAIIRNPYPASQGSAKGRKRALPLVTSRSRMQARQAGRTTRTSAFPILAYLHRPDGAAGALMKRYWKNTG